jgi:hypothetical protein
MHKVVLLINYSTVKLAAGNSPENREDAVQIISEKSI